MLPKQTILVADEDGNHNGEYVDKELAHTGRGKRHLAISVLLHNSRGQVLLQRRKHKVHDDIWELTGSTHHLHRDDGTDETSEEATYRCLKREYGIDEKIDLRVIGAVDYYAPYGEYCENEHDIILVGEYNGKLKSNKEVAYNYNWVDEKVFLNDIEKNPHKYAPWTVLGAKKFNNYKHDLFKSELKRFLGTFDRYISKYFTSKIRVAAKYPDLMTQFYRDLADFSSSGKKLRPFLVWIGYRAVGGQDIKRVLEAALWFELIQTFLLIHDDVIDQSDFRRNKPTVHKKYEKLGGSHYGESQAIIVGDLAAVEAFSLISSFDLSLRNKFIEIVKETVYGEALDVECSRLKPTLAQIKEVNVLKTAKYSIVGPMTIGAKLSNANTKQIQAIEKFGIALGIAFQLQDDVLGLFGDEKVLGKPVISDMREGKNTLLIHKTKEFIKGVDKRYLDQVWGSEKAGLKELEKVRKIVEDSGSLEWSKKETGKLIVEAKKYISNISNIPEVRQILAQMADYVGSRQS